ncbi:MAG TPA: S-methyl-5-thioribose-1-phosphate isomerase [Rhodocyclaceae bacterium]|nr:S-methyl-5-thioribose-1-phosphate isomerase [Rhodocyclaceae bacterium]
MMAKEPLCTLREDDGAIVILDQTLLPHRCETRRVATLEQAAHAIRSMQVRGAPLIGVTAAYGVALAMRNNASDAALADACSVLLAARPTAVNLRWGVEKMRALLAPLPEGERAEAAWQEAARIADEDVAINASIGRHGYEIIDALYQNNGHQAKNATVNILTHCNAGWLATVDWGTALAPIYTAFDAGIPLHVWVDETRPRNQGASLTAWELGQHGVPHTLIADNAGGHLMQHGLVDLVITGADRVTRCGDVANKIGTYLKALAARDNGVPFYVALPSSTFDFTLGDGVAGIPIEERAADEVRWVSGKNAQGVVESVQICPDSTPARNWGFDVTPARLVTQLICERGICDATETGIASLFSQELLT